MNINQLLVITFLLLLYTLSRKNYENFQGQITKEICVQRMLNNECNDPEKKEKHLKSFGFYRNDDQVYEKVLADKIYSQLLPLAENGTIDEVKLIDSNPANNPQPPSS